MKRTHRILRYTLGDNSKMYLEGVGYEGFDLTKKIYGVHEPWNFLKVINLSAERLFNYYK